MPSLVLAQRILGQIDVHASGDREGDDERRAHQEVGFDALMHARFEVAIAGQNAGGDQIVLADDLFDARIQRARVADAGRAAVTDEVEAQLVEILLQTGASRDIRSRLASRAPARSSPTATREPAFDRLLCQQAGGQHDAGIGGVGAGGDRGDQDVAVAQIDFSRAEYSSG